MEEQVRHATTADLARLVELAEAARAELAPTRGGAIWLRREARPDPLESSIAEALAADDHLVLAGELDGVVVGYAIARLESLRDGSVLAVLDDIYVEAGARSIGIGELLMNEVVAWATGRGCVGIDSIALPGNRATKNFFETFGLVARAILVHRDLRGEGVPPSEP